MARTDRSDGVSIINDAYNANPESMSAALRTLAQLGREILGSGKESCGLSRAEAGCDSKFYRKLH